MKTILITLSVFNYLYCQINFFHTQENIKLFADHLFCEKDYLRAIEEYVRLDENFINDSVLLKIGISYLKIGQFIQSENYFKKINDKSPLKEISNSFKSINFLLNNKVDSLEEFCSNLNFSNEIINKHLIISKLLFKDELPDSSVITRFNEFDKKFLTDLIQKKIDKKDKSPILAASLSLIPGLGKIYTENYTDGLTSFIITNLFAYLAVDNFNKSHNFRGYLFSITAIGFYLGNIVGSYYSAIKFNKSRQQKILDDSFEYLKNRNYLLDDVNLCN
ncbi:MAG: hypothetical protein NZM09_02140 [Ignavibacterium sp.]|nr:hypothetical protein [Ignavibacterium sp.]MDW8374476.1 hypothetical protein [Ignavibacteriales bacterium]